MSRSTVENTIPVLQVSDLERSIAFYKEFLGFDVEWSAATVCSVVRDSHSIMLRQSSNTGGGMVWIGVEDEPLFSHVQELGAKIVQPPTNNPHAYEMKIADPDGNVIWLGAESKT